MDARGTSRWAARAAGPVVAREDAMARRALLVGLNHYPDPANNLRGCVNDVLQVSSLLQRGFLFDASADIRLLTDERATTARIIERLRWLLRGAGPGDTLVFHYSGHGAQVRDRHGDELDDGLDEIICPYDLDWDDPFTDDDLHAILEDRACVPGRRRQPPCARNASSHLLTSAIAPRRSSRISAASAARR
jgi:hypothetical protein